MSLDRRRPTTVPACRGAAPKAATEKDRVAASEPAQSPGAAAPAALSEPAILVAADREDATAKVLLQGLEAAPAEGDLEVGMLTSVQQPNVLIRPTVTFISTTASDKTDKTPDFLTKLTFHGLVPFGDSSAPLLYKGRQVKVLHFSKPGLIARPSTGDAIVAQEGEPLLLVLENPSTPQYASVRARLRFENTDACLFTPDQFGVSGEEGKASKTGSSAAADAANGKGVGPTELSKSRAPQSTGCEANSGWTSFGIPQYAQVTLPAQPQSEWFRDRNTQFPKSAKRTGWLTLRYQGAGSNAIYEQSIALQIQFEPSGFSLIWALFCIFVWLLCGALLSLVLRVWVPNLKRKRQLNDQILDLERLTANISMNVDSNLRVLLEVKRRTLDEIRTGTAPIWPSYGAFAQRVEQALPSLKKHIEAAQNLDAALNRRRLLLEQGVALTRLSQIEDLLEGVSETLKQDQLSDEDWVSVNQQLSAAQKLVREPTLPDKEAFEALLSRRWNDIRDHFRQEANGELRIPPSLLDMEPCFPVASLLPQPAADATLWVKSIGVVRADLQLSALQLLWDFEFLAPRDPSDSAPSAGKPTEPPGASTEGEHSEAPVAAAEGAPAGTPVAHADGKQAQTDDHCFDKLAKRGQEAKEKWQEAKEELKPLLATPAIDNLRKAKLVLRRLAEQVGEEDIKKALEGGQALLMMDPNPLRPDTSIRFSVRFRNESLNSVAARKLVSCYWAFRDHQESASFYRRAKRYMRDLIRSHSGKVAAVTQAKRRAEADAAAMKPHWEDGWDVYHFFEKATDVSHICVNFDGSHGNPITPGAAGKMNADTGKASDGVGKKSDDADKESDDEKWWERTERPRPGPCGPEAWSRVGLEFIQLVAALLVPLVALAASTLRGGSTGQWWELVALGFGSDTIKNILVGRDEPASPPPTALK